MQQHPKHPACPCGHSPRETVREVAVKAAIRLVLHAHLWNAIVTAVTGAPPAW